MKIREKEATGMDFLCLALYAFAALGIEALYAYLLEPFLYGNAMDSWTTAQGIIHWILTCITWGICAFAILKYANLKYGFQLREGGGSIKTWRWILAIACALLVLVSSYIDWNGSKVLIEFQRNGLLKFIFQYIYYLFETLLFMLIIVFGQKAFEMWFHNKQVPYGAIIVALTWGMAHWFTKGSLFTGLFTAFCGFCFGVVYLLLNRNIKWTYLFLCIMFML